MQSLWFWIVSLMIATYAMLDGYDFGAGILHRFVARTDQERRDVLAAIGPYWDANEVWLIAGAASLYVSFPRVLAASFSGLYMAMYLVLWTLILRGIAIEFRSHVKDDLWRSFWDSVFVFASTLMPLFLGAALGNVIRGVPLDADRHFSLPLFTHFGTQNPIGILDWYTVLVSLFVFLTIASHGAFFLAWKTQGTVHARCRSIGLPLWCLATTFGIVVTFATAKVSSATYENFARAPLAWLGLALFVAGAVVVFVAHARGKDLAAFVGSSVFIFGILVATAGTMFPVMLRSTVDPAFSLTAYNASSSRNALVASAKWWFLGIPLVLAYFAIVFRLHRGKVSARDDGSGY
jgi:cytochrome bd ubiquinol oxidase subunit II